VLATESGLFSAERFLGALVFLPPFFQYAQGWLVLFYLFAWTTEAIFLVVCLSLFLLPFFFFLLAMATGPGTIQSESWGFSPPFFLRISQPTAVVLSLRFLVLSLFCLLCMRFACKGQLLLDASLSQQPRVA